MRIDLAIGAALVIMVVSLVAHAARDQIRLMQARDCADRSGCERVDKQCLQDLRDHCEALYGSFK